MLRKLVRLLLAMSFWFCCILLLFLTTAIAQQRFSLNQMDQLMLFLVGMFVGVLAWEMFLRRPIMAVIREIGPQER